MQLPSSLSILPQSRSLPASDRVNSGWSVFTPDLAGDNGTSGFFSSVGDFFTGLGNTALNIWGQKNTFDIQAAQAKANLASAQQPVVTQQAGVANMQPLLIAGAVGVVALLVLKK